MTHRRVRHRTLAGVALPSLSDPATMPLLPGGRGDAVELLREQLVLHLLTSRHVTVSHGFLFDNPALW